MEQTVDDYEKWILVKVRVQQLVYRSINWSLQFFSYSFDELVDVVSLFST
jgi:hypothetical protein